MKTLILSLTLGLALPAFAQSCPEVPLTNSNIFQSLLIEKARELINVKAMGLDRDREIIHFQIEGERRVRQFKYETCGWQVVFTEL